MNSGIALVFPGQGAQAVGMGRDFYDREPLARTMFDEAAGILGYDLAQLCFDGPKEQLNLTEFTQPALLTVSAVALRLVERAGIRAAAVAGHSLGEYTALLAAGGLEFHDALALVRKRGRYMQEAVDEGRGAVYAILGMERDAVVEGCREASARGVALLALVALGVLPDVGQVLPRLADPVQPDAKRGEIYQKAAARQMQLYKVLLGGVEE